MSVDREGPDGNLAERERATTRSKVLVLRVHLVLANARLKCAKGDPMPLRIRKMYMPVNTSKT